MQMGAAQPLVRHDASPISPISLHGPLADRESLGRSLHPKVGCAGGQAAKLFSKALCRAGVSGGQGLPSWAPPTAVGSLPP